MTPTTTVPRSVRILVLLIALLPLIACGGVTPGPSSGPSSGDVPAAPSDTRAVAGSSSVAVSWRDNSADETGFAVLRSTLVPGGETGSTSYDAIATVPADTSTFIDTGVASDASYRYAVAAVGAGGRSPASEPSLPVRPNPDGLAPVDPNDPVGVALNKLGIDTSATQRQNDNGTALPDGFSPLGAQVVFDRRDELFIAGRNLVGEAGRTALFEVDDDGEGQVVHTPDDVDHPWLDEPRGRFDATAGDVDGDGLEETVVVFMEDSELRIRIIDDALGGFAEQERFVVVRDGVVALTVVAGDFDGDAVDGLAVGLELGDRAEILFLGNLAADFAVVGSRSVATTVADATVSLALASGNLDQDNGEEIVVVANQTFRLPPPQNRDSGSARYLVLDDAGAGFAARAEELVQGDATAPFGALVAAVALGDIDGDPQNEIVFGGLSDFHSQCDDYGHLFLALDDLEADLAPLGAHHRLEALGNACADFDPTLLRWLPVATGDLDGDGKHEIVAGPFLFDDWAANAPWTPLGTTQGRYTDGRHRLYGDEAGIVLDRTATTLRVADLDGDGRSEVVHVMRENDAIRSWELDSEGVPTVAANLPVGGDPGNRTVIVAVNLDADSMVAQVVLEPGGTSVRHQLVFTEPVVLAALAAAPCDATLTSQNLGACSTAFGTGSSSGVAAAVSFTIKGSVHIGISVEDRTFTQSALEAKQSWTVEASASVGTSYQLEKRVVFSSGPLEDAVVFTTVPYDRYSYTVVQHPDPEMVGREITVSLPREQITLIVERSYYNASVAAGAVVVDDTVFAHAAGAPDSYRDRQEKDAFVRNLGLRGRPVLEDGPISVGQGGGATETEINVSREFSAGSSLALEWEREISATAGTIMVGFSVGFRVEASLTISAGSSTAYVGSVGNIRDPGEFAASRYSFGMFTYLHEDASSGQTFEVIDYWVE